jgi:flagellar biosynthetic protein FlhB
MSEERTQTPSAQRRRQARERGHVARSPELTAAVGLLVGIALVGFWGSDLVQELTALVREPWTGEVPLTADLSAVVIVVRGAAWNVLRSLGVIVAGVALSLVAAHQLQVGGLWLPGLLAPDPNRLWAGALGTSVLERAERGAWSLAKTMIILSVAAWSISTRLPVFNRLSQLGLEGLVTASGKLLRDVSGTLALALVALGVLDFAMQWRRREAQLAQTPAEYREELRALDGDPALLARRRRLAQQWRVDTLETFAGASVLITSRGRLAVLLAGGPPPRRVTVRNVARGAAAAFLRRAAERAGVPRAESPELAQLLARGPSIGATLPSADASALAAIWPAKQTT